MLGRLARNPLTWVVVGVLAAAGVFGLYWFQPWKLFTSKTVNEVLPTFEAPASSPPTSTPGATPAAPAANALLATGDLITHEHDDQRLGEARPARRRPGPAHVREPLHLRRP